MENKKKNVTLFYFCVNLGKVVLRRLGFWARNGHSFYIEPIGEVLRVARWSNNHHWQWAIQMSRSSVPAIVPRHGNRWYSRNLLQLDHEVRHWYSQGSVRQYSLVGWHHHVPRHRRPHAKGDHCLGAKQHEGQDHRSAGAQILCLDRWLHPGLIVHLSVHVDLQAGVWRVGTVHRPPQVLLD